jgi:hypothetical protein
LVLLTLTEFIRNLLRGGLLAAFVDGLGVLASDVVVDVFFFFVAMEFAVVRGELRFSN